MERFVSAAPAARVGEEERFGGVLDAHERAERRFRERFASSHGANDRLDPLLHFATPTEQDSRYFHGCPAEPRYDSQPCQHHHRYRAGRSS